MLGIYTRLSVEDQQSTSIENQIREGKDFAELKGVKYSIYNEGEGVSGTLDINDRPILLQLIGDIKEGLIEAVWMRNQNRLDRNSLTFFIFVEAAKKNDIEVFFGNDKKLDFNDPSTLLQSSILSALNAYQAQLQSTQTKKALLGSAKEGKAWGILPYGYATDENKNIVINKEEAEVVEEIFQLNLNGWGTRRISTYLSKQGIPTRYNKYDGKLKIRNKHDDSITEREYKDIVWSQKTVNDILKNKWYVGERTFQKIQLPTPVIISIDIFEKAQENLKSNKYKTGKAVEYRYLLKGLLRCSKCGRNYYGRTKKNKTDNYYMCSSKRYPTLNCGNRSISIPYLENFIIKHLFDSKDLLKKLEKIDKEDKSLIILKDELENLKESNIKLQKTLEKLSFVLGDSDLKDDITILKRYKEAKSKIETNNARIKVVESRIKNRENKTHLNAYKKRLGVVDLHNFSKLKEAIHTIVERIEIEFSEGSYKIIVKYKGYEEQGTFITKFPYTIWHYLIKEYTEPTALDILESVMSFKEIHGIDLPQEYWEGLKKENYTQLMLNNIHINKSELIEFN